MRSFFQKAKEAVEVVWNVTKAGMAKAIKGLASLTGEALSSLETKKRAADIRAQGALYNLQRQAAREYPRVFLNSAQEMVFVLPEYQGQGAYIQLDPEQSEQVFRHMLEQYCLDKDSRAELAAVIAPKVGVPALLELVAIAHETVGRELIVPFINKGKLEEHKLEYGDIVNFPIYEGTTDSILLKYNLHSDTPCNNFKNAYGKSRKHVDRIRRKLRSVGVEIDHIEVVDTIYLEVYLKWAGA